MEEMWSAGGQVDATGLIRLKLQATGDEDFWIVFSWATHYTPGHQCLQVSFKQLKSG